MEAAERKSYLSDLGDEQWEIIDPHIPKYKSGRPPKVKHREVINAINYVLKTGCQWRMLPHDFGIKWTVVYDWFRRWRDTGVWRRIHDALLAPTRAALGKKDPEPSATIIDSQTIKGTETTENAGYDAGKKTKGRKRHLVVDTLGLIVALVVTSADVTDAKGAEQCLRQPNIRNNRRLKVIFADQGYHRHELYDFIKREQAGYRLEIVKKKDGEVGFKILAKRWIVERTNSWMRSARRLGKDYERLERSSESLIYFRCTTLMLNRIVKAGKRNAEQPGQPSVA